MAPLVDVSALRVTARTDGGEEVAIVKDVSFTVNRSEVLALIGESGSGKTTIALSLLGYARAGCRIAGGRIRVGDTDVLSLSGAALADFRGRTVSYIAQSAAATFNPAHRIMPQVVECARIHGLMSAVEAEAKAKALFAAIALPDPQRIGDRFPHQVSGGQLQRLMAAMALLSDPALVVMDEPTTALDVTTQIEVLKAFKAVVREKGTTAIYVSHDLAVVAQIADRIIVLRDGEMREIGSSEQILAAPRHEYTRSLLAAANPAVRPPPPRQAVASAPPLLEVRGLMAGYGSLTREGLPRVPVLEDVNLTIPSGTALGVIGESGCGKSTLARVIAGLLPAASGSILLNGVPLAASAAARSRDDLRRIQIVFQMADTALNPARTVERIIGRPFAFYHGRSGADLRRRVVELLDMVRLPAAIAQRYPDELSGGQKQRVNLARALAAEPDLILCDEVTSALDTVVGAAILDLMAELRRELGVAYMFISHDLVTVRSICDDIMLLYAGQMVEAGSRQAFGQLPLHPYSDLLISSVPELRTGWLDEISETHLAEASGAVAASPGAGCRFFSRCAARVDNLCDNQKPPVWRAAKGTVLRCHRSEQDLLVLQSRLRPPPMSLTARV